MEVWDKLTILADAAKYDVACTSSGSDRAGAKGSLGSCSAPGICHSFSADGRCVSLLKVLFSNACSYDCKYCQSRRSNDFVRAAFTPRELAELTIAFYRRNYIEGLFLSSAVCRSPDWTCERMIETLRLLREEYRFRGYIHVKAIPGASGELIERLGLLADRMSVNIELPSEEGLSRLAPDKTREAILRPMALIRNAAAQSQEELVKYRHARPFAPAGQSTQMIVGATADSDLQILRLTQALYRKYQLKRVFFSAISRLYPIPCCLRWRSSLLFCGSTGSIRPTGCSAITGSRRRSCLTNKIPASTHCLTPNATGRSIIWKNFRSRSIPRPSNACCGCRVLECAAPNEFPPPAATARLTLTDCAGSG